MLAGLLAEHESYFLRSCGGLFGPVLLVNCVPELSGCHIYRIVCGVASGWWV